MYSNKQLLHNVQVFLWCAKQHLPVPPKAGHGVWICVFLK
jgi:hypothetical protein